MQNLRIVVSIPGEEDYDVRAGTGLLSTLGDQLRRCPSTAKAPKLIVITDQNVERLYLDAAMASRADAGYEASSVVVPAGKVAGTPLKAMPSTSNHPWNR